LYEGVIAFTSKNNIKVDVNFGLTPKVTVTTPWTNRATSTPIDDLRVAVKAYKDKNAGVAPRYIDMSGDALMDITLNQQVRGAIFGVNNSMLPSRAQVEALITQIADAPIVIRVNDDQISVEGETPTRLLQARTVVLLGAQPIITVHGPTVEKNFEPGIYVLPIVKEGPPPSEEIYVGESAFVGIKKPSEVYRLTV